MSDKFLGFTKFQFAAVLIVVMAVMLGMQAYTAVTARSAASQAAMVARQTAAQAAQGLQAHAALCVYRRDLAQRAQGSRTFLDLTPVERAKKYGPAFAAIPAATIRASLKNQEATLKSLTILDCAR